MNVGRGCAIFSLGFAAGAAVALLCAPQSGVRTRKQLKRNLQDAGEYLKDSSEDLSKHASRVYRKAKDVAGKVGDLR